jgi:hypothetical protein
MPRIVVMIMALISGKAVVAFSHQDLEMGGEN